MASVYSRVAATYSFFLSAKDQERQRELTQYRARGPTVFVSLQFFLLGSLSFLFWCEVRQRCLRWRIAGGGGVRGRGAMERSRRTISRRRLESVCLMFVAVVVTIVAVVLLAR